MSFCLPQKFADKIKLAIRDGRLNPDKLNSMTSQQRRDFLSGIVGAENAKQVNLLFEKKLLLKNQERAMFDWAKQITGLSQEQKDATLKKIRETYAEKKRRLEDPKENEIFLNEIISDVFSKKFKTEVTLEESENIIKLTSDLRQKRKALDAVLNENNEYKNPQDQFTKGYDFGAAKVALEKYTGNLKQEANKLPWFKWDKQRGIIKNTEVMGRNIGKVGGFIADNSRALKASFDNSFFGRQARKVMSRPATSKLWWNSFIKSWKDIGSIIRYGNSRGDAIKDATIAEIYSRENYLKGYYDSKDGKLDIGTAEEEYPSSLPERIPVLGRVFKASEIAFETSATRMRADIADVFYNLAEKQEVDLKNDFETGSLNRVVNEMTGRGKISGLSEDSQKKLNTVFFSPKFAKAQVDSLFSWAYFGRSEFARKQSALNLLTLVSSTAIAMAISFGIDPDSIEWDPTSSDFGKIKIKNTRFDLTGGLGSYIVLMYRTLSNKKKSSITGVKKEMGVDYGDANALDVFFDFISNKTSPIASIVKNLIQRETFGGEKPNIVNITTDLTVPILIETGTDASETEGIVTTLLAIIADGIGVSSNTYIYKTNWSTSTSKWTKKWKLEKGDKSLREANNKYNIKVNEKIIELRKDEEFLKQTDEDKLKELDKEKRLIKKDIFREYDFRD